MPKRLLKFIFVSATFVAVIPICPAQSNLLQNPNADLQSQSWLGHGHAMVEACSLNNPCFVVRRTTAQRISKLPVARKDWPNRKHEASSVVSLFL